MSERPEVSEVHLSDEDSREPSTVKISDARGVVERRGLDWAVVIGRDVDGYHRSTFGVEPQDKDEAAACADYCLREMPETPGSMTDRRAENAVPAAKAEAMEEALREWERLTPEHVSNRGLRLVDWLNVRAAEYRKEARDE